MKMRPELLFLKCMYLNRRHGFVWMLLLLSQVPAFSNFMPFPGGYYQMIPGMYPALVPGLTLPQHEENGNRGAGIYAVPVNPYDRQVTGLPYNTLIPLTYRTPT